jgi:spermidine synthase
MLKNNRIQRSFIVQIADLVFHVEPNKLTVGNGKTFVETECSVNDIEVLEAFAAQAKSILSPLPNSKVVYNITDGPQNITLVKKNSDYMLIINSQIQFTTQSEEIYHEALVMPAFGSARDPKTCLILGGGDGLAAKQIFKHYPNTEVTLVDFDKNITDLFTNDPVMAEINEGAMKKCTVINDDAYYYVYNDEKKYDVIICDFPDPDHEIFNKLYSFEFYEQVKTRLNENGAMVVQSGSLVPNSKCFPCIKRTLEEAGFETLSYYTPTTYGELVYNLCVKMEDKYTTPYISFPPNLKTMDLDFFQNAMCNLRPGLISKDVVEVNTVENNAALSYRVEELENLKK